MFYLYYFHAQYGILAFAKFKLQDCLHPDPPKKMHSALLRVLSCPCFFVVVVVVIVVVVDCSGIQRNPQTIRAHKSLKPPE